MDVREKLVELLCEVQYLGGLEEKIADHLIANGVTVQEWIPVTERLPEEPLETVLVTNGRSVYVGVYSVVYEEFGVMCGRGQEKRFGVTHWMPLPPAPKGE